MYNFWDDVKPFKPAKAIAWIEATRQSYNQNNPYGENLTFAETVEMLRDSACNEDEDYRALKALDQMQEQAELAWLNGLSSVADARQVDKFRKSFG